MGQVFSEGLPDMSDIGLYQGDDQPQRAAEPAFDLLVSKLRRPLPRPEAVRRSALIERLAASDQRPVISVVAPAGYGKTTLLSQWAEANGPAFAWVSVDNSDNDPRVLLSSVAQALNAVEPVDRQVFAALASPSSSVPGSVVPGLGAAFSSMSAPLVLVLDDVHALHDRESRAALSVLAEHVPGGSHLVLAGRVEPPLRAARLRAEGRLLEIGPDDLAFTREEAALLLRNAGLTLGEDDVAELHRRTEGWPAGLYLAALYLRGGGALPKAAASFGGDDRYVTAYLESEFLAPMSHKQRVFLTRTAVLERMCGPLCDAVLKRDGSSSVLADLARSNMLLVPLDRRGEWYRYYHLFRDMLLAELERLEPGLIPVLRRRAASWCLRNGLPEEAREYSMAAGDVDAVADIGQGHQAKDPVSGGSANAGPPAGSSADIGIPEPRRRYLRGQCPESIPVGERFSLLASIVREAGPGSRQLKPFDVPPEGRDVLLVAHTRGLQLLSEQHQTVHVPTDGDSEPVRFELRADAPGPRPVSITAWIGGSYLGELLVVITAERGRPPGPHQDILVEITMEPAEGAVSLVVRYDPPQKAYRFEFIDEDHPGEVTSNLAYDPGPLVEHLVAGLDELAKGRSGYSAVQTRDYLENAGAGLWRELVPPALREQFWDRQHRIRQLTILADKDVVPWELLYPLDPGHEAGFLVEQFPVTRAVFRRRLTRRLSLWPARFVLPAGSLPQARDEIDAMRWLLDPGQASDEIISGLTPLRDLIESGTFGLLHFACHGTYNPVGGSSIKLDNVQFTPTLMTKAANGQVLAGSAPTVFINACRSAGLAATYNRLDGWASKFLEAGAAAFIGTLWAVSDGASREFAQELYSRLQTGSSLGEAVKYARTAAASQLDDPTWLAYTVYGDPRATLSQQRP